MPHPIKIATCCYCSARTMLRPTARHGHELACGSCGAPLHEMKWLKVAPATAPIRRPVKISKPTRPAPSKPRKSYRPKKRRKSMFSEILEEVWDWAEDILD